MRSSSAFGSRLRLAASASAMLIGSLLTSPWVIRACLVEVLDGLLPEVQFAEAERFLSGRVDDARELFVEPVDRVEVVADQGRLEVADREHHRVVLPRVTRRYRRFSLMYLCEVAMFDIELLLPLLSNCSLESAESRSMEALSVQATPNRLRLASAVLVARSPFAVARLLAVR